MANEDDESGTNNENVGDEKSFKKVEGGLSTIIEEIHGAIPEVSEHVVNDDSPLESESGENVETVKSVHPPKHVVNEKGETFDPAVHAVDNDGNPKITKNGYFRKLHKSKISTSSIGGDSTMNPTESQAQNNDAVLISKCGAALASHSRSVIADLPATPDEMTYLEQSFFIWADATGKTMSPTQGLVAALAIFYLPAIQAPKTVSKAKLLWIWVGSKFKRNKVNKLKPEDTKQPEKRVEV